MRPHQGDAPGDLGDGLCRCDIVLEAAHGALKLSGVRVNCHAGSVRNPGAVRSLARTRSLAGGRGGGGSAQIHVMRPRAVGGCRARALQ